MPHLYISGCTCCCLLVVRAEDDAVDKEDDEDGQEYHVLAGHNALI
jgi:hypothetical protein